MTWEQRITDPLAAGADLRGLIDVSPSPCHAVAEMARRLREAGFKALDERDRWDLGPGDCRYVVRDDSSLIAFRLGSAALAETGARLIGAHTDSPTLKVRPRHDLDRAGYRLVGVEPYGGLLAHTWLDRELTVAGRLAIRGQDGKVSTRLVMLPGGQLRLPSLAIHLDRGLRDGLVLDPQRHLVPVWGQGVGTEAALIAALAEVAGVPAGDVLGHDLVLADTQPAAPTGRDGTWIAASRLDNLASCYAGLQALLAAEPVAHTQILVANDHEEVGSGSAEGARGSFLADLLERLVVAAGDTDGQALHRAIACSVLVSADMAHALHPNHTERHEPAHTPALGGGPVLKVNAQQAYATDAGTGGWFTARCRDAGVAVQHFVSRADQPCGSTIGPLTAARLGVATVDVGSPMLGMHSCRELASAVDVPLMTAALTACLSLG